MEYAENPLKSKRYLISNLFMLQKPNLKQKAALRCNGGRDHSKNAASSKSHTSRNHTQTILK